MSVEDAFKVVVSGGIVAPNPCLPDLDLIQEHKIEKSLQEMKQI